MKRALILFFQVIVVLFGVLVLTFLLWEPHLEGRNIGATIFKIYFKDLFLAYVYFVSIFFFIGLYQVFKLIGYIGENKLASLASSKALRMIRHCAISIIFFILGAEIYFFIFQSSKGEDIAGGVIIGVLMMLIASIATIIVKYLEKIALKSIPK